VTAGGGCGTEESPGRLVVHLVDAPHPFDLLEAAEVTITSLEARVETEGDVAFHVLSEETRTLDLLDLRNGLAETLAMVEMEAPSVVDQLRLGVTSARVVLLDGREFDLGVPGGETSGLKVFPDRPVAIEPGTTTEILLDFDVSRSLEAIPSGPRKVDDVRGFRFRPRLRAVDLAATASVYGQVLTDAGTEDILDDVPVPDATVRVKAGNQVLTTVTDSAGRYCILGVPAGSHVVTAAAPGHEEANIPVTLAAQASVDTHGDLLLHATGE
jgi:hypothetical protein